MDPEVSDSTPGAAAGGTTLFDAVDEQLGLRLEEQKVPTTGLVVDHVDQRPTANSPDVVSKRPPLPREFEVADIKPTDPNARSTPSQIGLLPGGRVNLPGVSLKRLVTLAWDLNPDEEMVGAAKWLDSARFDIKAKAPADITPAPGAAVPLQELELMLQTLLIDRFKMKSHFEERQVTAYRLVSTKTENSTKRIPPLVRM